MKLLRQIRACFLLYVNYRLRLQTKAAVILSLDEVDRWQLVSHMDEHQVAELLSSLASKLRQSFIDSLALKDPTLATCAMEAMW